MYVALTTQQQQLIGHPTTAIKDTEACRCVVALLLSTDSSELFSVVAVALDVPITVTFWCVPTYCSREIFQFYKSFRAYLADNQIRTYQISGGGV